MVIEGVAKRSTGTFIPKGESEAIDYDSVKIHVKYEPGIDDDIPEMVAGDAYDIIKLKWNIWKQFLDQNDLKVSDVIGMSVELVYNRYGKPSGLRPL